MKCSLEFEKYDTFHDDGPEVCARYNSTGGIGIKLDGTDAEAYIGDCLDSCFAEAACLGIIFSISRSLIISSLRVFL